VRNGAADRKLLMKIIILPILLIALGTPASAQPLELFGYLGELGEWELTAKVVAKSESVTQELSGPLTMRHVGICTQDGPEERTGEIRLQISEPPSRLHATLLLDGVECSYRGRLSNFYTGELRCPNRATVPLLLWIK
jgi:hypothetical protein